MDIRRCSLHAWLLLAMASVGIAAVRPAGAHPHVFIDNVVTFIFSTDKIVGFHLSWSFDEVFSETLVQDFDADGDGRLDVGETEAIKASSLPSLGEYDYFLHLWVDGVPVETFGAVDMTVVQDGARVTYELEVTLETPLDSRRDRIEVSVYDDSYYVEVVLAHPDPVRLAGIPDGSCTYRVVEDDARAYYYETVYPQVVVLTC
jgi:tRNA threonylcarbamoyladenosine biosynthesis protein TsaE